MDGDLRAPVAWVRMSGEEPNPEEDGARRSPSTLGSAESKQYPGRLFHATPPWVKAGSVFHIRVRCQPQNVSSPIDPKIGPALLKSVEFYHTRSRWWVGLFLLMPDHWHALVSFPQGEEMGKVIGDWKRFQEKQHGIVWQEGYFDHRIRNDDELQLKADYIRKNPVAKGLCARPEDWPWVWPRA
ncbi:MAG: hypothetical protein HY736_12490 [Verrucomicrobia bacterium]|nr:hypothetical protein [Verrucomicrobiota bacterium]